MIGRISLKLICLTSMIATGSATNAAPSNIDSEKRYSWSENTGWMNWRDANSGTDGVFVDTDYLSGYVWMENVGWLNVGDGTPSNLTSYANVNTAWTMLPNLAA